MHKEAASTLVSSMTAQRILVLRMATLRASNVSCMIRNNAYFAVLSASSGEEPRLEPK